MENKEYGELLKQIPEMTYKQIVNTHQSLLETVDLQYSTRFMFNALNVDSNHLYSKEVLNVYTPEVEKFVNSRYASNYFKQLVKSKLPLANVSDAVLDALESERTFLEFSEDELSEIYQALKKLEKDYTHMHFLDYTLKLNSDSAKSFANNKADSKSVIKSILDRSGIVESPYHYTGRGVHLGDLNATTLISIYQKLARLDNKKALSVVKMIFAKKTLGATEFLFALHNLVDHEYDLSVSQIEDFGYERETMEDLKNTAAIQEDFASMLPQEVLSEIVEFKQRK